MDTRHLEVKIYSHYFSCRVITARGNDVCIAFAKRFVQHGYVKKKRYMAKVPLRVFATATEDKSEYRFHINTLNDFRDHLLNNQVTDSLVSFETIPPPESKNINLAARKGWVLKKDQIDPYDYLISPGKNKLLTLQTGTGKAQPLDAKIKVPNGWQTMAEMTIGTKVITKDGSTTTVTGVFPQGEKQIYRITFEDGRSTTCCLDHLWKVYRGNSFCSIVLTTKEILENPDCYYIDLCNPSQEQSAFELSKDSLSKGLIKDLGTINQRINFIENEVGRIRYRDSEYYDCNIFLITNIVNIIRSLGGRASYELIRKDTPVEQYRIKYNLNGLLKGYSKLKIKDITYIGVAPAQCISIAHPSNLYITDDYIVTHNTVIAIMACIELGKRVVCVLRPQFVKKWVQDFTSICNIKPESILQVRGSAALLTMLNDAAEGNLKEKIIIISNKTMQNWFKLYKEHKEYSKEFGYPCYPHEMYALLKAGLRLVDEVHLDMHLQCIVDLHTHVEDSYSLSATLMSNDYFISKMQEMLYPLKDRYDSGELNRFIDSHGVTYKIQDMRNIRTTEFGRTTYSHMAFEKSLLRNTKVLLGYFELIGKLIDFYFINLKRRKKKLLVYAATIAMCEELTNYFIKRYPNLDVRRYCDGDPYENLLEPDIRFTTILSGGVGHDISDLTTVIMTTAISSIQSNIQALGRLRKLSDGHSVEFLFLTCESIEKHISYHKEKVEMLKNRAKSYREVRTGLVL